MFIGFEEISLTLYWRLFHKAFVYLNEYLRVLCEYLRVLFGKILKSLTTKDTKESTKAHKGRKVD